jgi:type II secretion system protein C
MISRSHQKQLISLLNAVLLLLIIWLWAKFALFDNSSQNFDAIKTNSSYSVANANQNQGSIAQYHIFGSAEQLYDVPLSQGQTSLDFTLNGTMSSTDANNGMAYISSAQGVQKKFRVGDKIFDTATLKEVYKTYVVIQHNGKNERLKLTDNSQVVQTSPKNNKKTAQSKTKPDYLKHLNGNQNRNWQQILDKQKFDPNKISSIVSNINIVADQAGDIKGLRVSNLANGDLLSKHGLKSNDIITGINGNPVSAKNMLTIQQTLEKSPNATVTIKRNGKIKNIQINLSDF